MGIRFVLNSASRSLATMFPGFFPTAKHNHYADFGWPESVEFRQFFDIYTRNGIARAGIDRTILKTWQDMPFLLEKERDGSEGAVKEETNLEREIRLRFAALRLWQRLAEADRRSLVGNYAGVILRFADSKRFAEPVARVPGGLDGLVEIIPAWEGQLAVSEWDTSETSPTYGQPMMFQFNEAAVGKIGGQPRAFNVHPDRVVVWSRDGTIHARSSLEPGYNDLMTLEKVIGAGGEGFWKNAKSAPVLEVDAEANIEAMARAMGVKPEEIADKMSAQVEGWQKGFDKLLMVQGIQAKTLGVTLPSPEHFVAVALQSFAASLSIPLKILVGTQTGERASTEDAAEWAQTNMSRRNNEVVPNIMTLVDRLVRVGIIPERDWHLDWSDLTESSMSEKIDRANKMADTNQKMKDGGELVFTPEEIRAAVDLEPLSEADKFREEPEDDETGAAITPPAKAK
jgi:uncharacterized protein